MRAFKYVAVMMLSISIGSTVWSAEPKKIRKANEPVTQNVSIEGQIFIVTKGQQAVKLALVPISVVAGDDLMTFLKNKAALANIARQDLAPTVKRLKEEKDAIENQSKPDKERLSYLRTAVVNEYAKCSSLKGNATAWMRCTDSPELVNSKREADSLDYSLKPIREKEKEARQAYNSVKFDYDKLIREDVILDGIESLPQIGNAKTDADGKFSLLVPVPSGKNVAVLAKSNRKIYNDTEDYRWIVWVKPNSGNNRLSLTLANDNLFDTACADCVTYSNLIQANDIGQ